jgi:hypothetical protein
MTGASATIWGSRQALPGRGARCGGRRCAPTSLRCSPSSRAAELAAFASLSTLKQLRRVSSRCALTRADSRAALLAAPEFAPGGQRLPRNSGVAVPASAHHAGSCKGVCGQAVARLRGAEKRSARGCARSALRHLARRSCLSVESEANAASSATQATRPSIAGKSARSVDRLAEAPRSARMRLCRPRQQKEK